MAGCRPHSVPAQLLPQTANTPHALAANLPLPLPIVLPRSGVSHDYELEWDSLVQDRTAAQV